MGITKCDQGVNMLMMFVLFSVAVVVEGKPRLVIIRNEDNEFVEVALKRIVVSEGQNLSLTCKVVDFDDRPVWRKETKYLRVFGNETTLRLYPVNFLDSGKYICESLKLNIDKSIIIIVKTMDSLVRNKRTQHGYNTNYGNMGYYPQHDSTFNQQKNSYIQSIPNSQTNNIDYNNYNTYYKSVDNNVYTYNKYEHDVGKHKKSAAKTQNGFVYFLVAMGIVGLISVIIHLYRLATRGDRSSLQETEDLSGYTTPQQVELRSRAYRIVADDTRSLPETEDINQHMTPQVENRYREYRTPLRRTASVPLDTTIYPTMIVQDVGPTVTTTLITPTIENTSEADLPPSYNTCDRDLSNIEPTSASAPSHDDLDLPPTYAEALENMFGNSAVSIVPLNSQESQRSLPRN